MSKFSSGNNRAAKLSNEQVLELRRLYLTEGWTQGQLARHFGVAINTVGRIVRGETRQRVPMPADPQESARKLDDLIAAEAARALERLQQDIHREKAKPNPDRDLADWDRARKYGAEEE